MADQGARRPDERIVTVLPAAAELIGRSGGLIRLRWVAVVGVAVFLAVAPRLFSVELELPRLYAVIAALALYTAALAAANRRLARGEAGHWLGKFRVLEQVLVPRALWDMELEGRALQAAAFANAQISLDLIALGALLHFAGGIENPFISFFVFHAIIASILLSRRASYVQATLAVLVISAVAVGEATGLLRHYALQGVWREGAYRDPMLIGAELFVLSATLYLSVYMGSTIAAHLRGREREVAVLSGQMASKAIALEAAYARLAEVERTKSQYMRKVAHELRGPLGTVQTALKVVLQGPTAALEPESKELIARAERRAGDLAALTVDLLALSRAREWQVLAEEDDVDLGALIVEEVGDAVERGRACGVTVVLASSEGAPVGMKGDRQGLRQLVSNLLSNAIRYTPTGGHIVVRLLGEGEKVTITVEDTGIGIAAADLPHIFDEFFRSSAARQHASDGTGLGLSIVRAVAEQHRGTVRVTSAVNEGTTFTVELPVHRAIAAR